MPNLSPTETLNEKPSVIPHAQGNPAPGTMEKGLATHASRESLVLPPQEASESDPSTSPWKYKLIALICALLMSAGSHFSTNALNALKTTLKSEMHINNTQYGVMSSSVSLINTILPFLGGVWMDRFGTGWGALLSTGLIVVGNAFSAMASHLDSYAWMVVSRIIFGLGSGCVVVAQETILSKWFRGKGLAITIGLQITVSRLVGLPFPLASKHVMSCDVMLWRRYCSLIIHIYLPCSSSSLRTVQLPGSWHSCPHQGEYGFLRKLLLGSLRYLSSIMDLHRHLPSPSQVHGWMGDGEKVTLFPGKGHTYPPGLLDPPPQHLHLWWGLDALFGHCHRVCPAEVRD